MEFQELNSQECEMIDGGGPIIAGLIIGGGCVLICAGCMWLGYKIAKKFG